MIWVDIRKRALILNVWVITGAYLCAPYICVWDRSKFSTDIGYNSYERVTKYEIIQYDIISDRKIKYFKKNIE